MIEGKDVIPVPSVYLSEFKRDPLDTLLKYGSMPQRARAPWFTDTKGIDECLTLPDQICGPTAEKLTIGEAGHEYRAMVASREPPTAMLEAIAPTFRSADDGYWHVHVDLALNKKRHGDAAGIAMGRISGEWEERVDLAGQEGYRRTVRTYEIPLVAQIVAPVGDQIYLGGVVRLILQLRQVLGFNITSFSTDTFQSAETGQELTHAGLVTVGMEIDEETGIISGLPKPFSVDGRSVAPYRELLEGVNERRIHLPKYEKLRQELRQLECLDPGYAPDHPVSGSKDVADPCAGVVGYLSIFGHAILSPPEELFVNREDLEQRYGLPESGAFGVEGETGEWDFGVEGDQFAGFGVE